MVEEKEVEGGKVGGGNMEEVEKVEENEVDGM